jgi:hypothetical protein
MTRPYEFTLPIILIVLILLADYPVKLPVVNASPDIVFSDVEDGLVYDYGSIYTGGIWAGDETGTSVIRGFVKFDLSGIPLGHMITSATLNLYLYASRNDDVYDAASPLTNPDSSGPSIGPCRVFHILDYGTLSVDDFNPTLLSNHPGILLDTTVTPSFGYVSIDVTAAMQDDVANGRAFSAFMIRMTTEPDGNTIRDRWEFWSMERTGTDEDPYIEYSTRRSGTIPNLPSTVVGGIQIPVNNLMVLLPYFALLSSICVISAILVARKKRKS